MVFEESKNPRFASGIIYDCGKVQGLSYLIQLSRNGRIDPLSKHHFPLNLITKKIAYSEKAREENHEPSVSAHSLLKMLTPTASCQDETLSFTIVFNVCQSISILLNPGNSL